MPLTIPLALGALGSGALGGGVLAYAHWLERSRVQLDRYELVIDKPGLPPKGLVILHLSDFHFRAQDAVQARRLKRLRQLLRGQRYDILALTGDLIHDQAGLPTALAFLRELQPRIAAFSVPGNRDYWQSSFKAVLGTRAERQEYGLAGQAWRATRMVGRSACPCSVHGTGRAHTWRAGRRRGGLNAKNPRCS